MYNFTAVNVIQKCTYLLLGLFMVPFTLLQAQNFAPNPSFETFTTCPTAQSQIARAVPWDRPPSAFTTPDYYNACATTTGTGCGNIDVPDNFGGSSTAFDGVAYTGIISYLHILFELP